MQLAGSPLRLFPLLALVALAPSVHATPNAAPGAAEGIVAELNRARTSPAAYARELEVHRRYYAGRIVREPGEPIDRITLEGVAAVDEAIAFLRRQPRRAPLSHSQALALAAGDHVRDQGPTGSWGHVARDGTTPFDRVERRGVRAFQVGETIAYGPRTARAVVRELIVDDGVGDRGHRTAIFDAEYGRAGAACGAHKGYRIMCVIDFASTDEAPRGARMFH